MRHFAIACSILALLAGGCAVPSAGERRMPALTEITAPKPSQLLVQLVRLKNPVAKPLQFTPEQRQEIHDALQPGDLLMTYTAGVSSNMLIPGKFKHVMVYVGPTATAEIESGVANTKEQSEPADVVEATADGVALVSLDRTLSTRINCLAVLRPRLSDEERSAYLADVLSYLGDKYDFSFDFHEHTRKSCTELVYCALNGRNGIELALTPRAGRMTLTSDDIVNYHLKQPRDASGFDCILMADGRNQPANTARVTFGAESQTHLSSLMTVPPLRR